jgi:hypothetical protein
MSGLLTLSGEHTKADISVGPGDLAAHAVDQYPTIHEQFNELLHSEVGGLGALFGHDPAEHYPAPLETSPEPTIEAGTLGTMQSSMSLAAANSPEPDPDKPQVVAAKSVGGWKFSDTLRNEVLKARDRITSMTQGGQGG